MSYILEALKKSQQTRELGRIPTMNSGIVFRADHAVQKSQPWGLLAVGLAGVAVLIALYAALREPISPAPINITDPVKSTANLTSAKFSADSAPQQIQLAPPALVEAPPLPKPQPRPQITEPNKISHLEPEPQVIEKVIATAAVNSKPQLEEHNAQEKKAPPNRAIPSSHAPSELDRELELDLQRKMAEQQAQPTINPTAPMIESELSEPTPTPIPEDLIADIAGFKQQVRRENNIPPANKNHHSVLIKGDPTRLKLTPAQQAQLPAFLMTAHVYDREAAKRFIIINSLKYQEGEETREGLWIERIIPEGAVLSYLNLAFFIAR